MLHRFPEGRRRARRCTRSGCRTGAPPWVETVRLHFPRYGLHADELCVTELADVIWAVQMSTVEFHPWNSRRADTEQPDEWRIDLDPMPDCPFDTVRRVAARRPRGARRARRRRLAQDLGRHGPARLRAHRAATGASRTYAGRALAFAREVERRAPDDVTTTWWRKDRDPATLFVDYNQNARDHTIAGGLLACAATRAARSPRRSTWDEVADVEPHDFTIATVPARFARLGDLHAGIDDAVFDFDPLLEWAERDERDGQDVPPGARRAADSPRVLHRRSHPDSVVMG